MLLRAIAAIMLLAAAACTAPANEPPPVGTNCVHLGRTGILDCR